jgi:hypothetical protein
MTTRPAPHVTLLPVVHDPSPTTVHETEEKGEPVETIDTTRRHLLALALPATGALFLVGEALTPKGLDQTPMSVKSALDLLPKAAGHTNQLYLGNALVLLGLGTLLISYIAMTQLARRRGAALATIACAIGCLAAFAGIVANVLVGFNIATAVSAHLEATQAAQFIARSFSSKTGEAFLNIYFIGNIVALVLMAVALWRSHTVPRWAAILLPVTFELAASAPAGPIAIPFMIPFLVVGVVIARSIWNLDVGADTSSAYGMTTAAAGA